PIILLLGIWWFITYGVVELRMIPPNILPSPAEVFRQIPRLFHTSSDEPSFLAHVLISLRRVGLAYLLALAIVLPLGVLMGAFGTVRAIFGPLTTASGYIPIATLVPLTMAWFG